MTTNAINAANASNEAPSSVVADEVHPLLSARDMVDIREFREKLAYKTPAQAHKLYYEWTVTRKLSARQHTLLGIYLFSRV